MPKRYEIRSIKGIEYKLCRGPMHVEGGAWVPTDKFYRRWDSKQRLRANCKSCEYIARYNKPSDTKIGYFPIDKLRFALLELERRLGPIEAIRRVGVSNSTWYRWKKETKLVRFSKAILVINTLKEVRANREVRHRDSISHGAAMRGRKEKVPTTRRDFYKPQD